MIKSPLACDLVLTLEAHPEARTSWKCIHLFLLKMLLKPDPHFELFWCHFRVSLQ